MAAFVIVHGAWGGGWEWRDVEARLRARGHEVTRPTLTGLGERSHLVSSEVTLETHLEDVLRHLRFEDLRGVVLCGHSYGGMVVRGVADRMPERIAGVVYVDALVPADGECAFDLIGPGFANALRASATGGLLPAPPYEESVATHGEWYAKRVVALDVCIERARTAGWTMREIATQHDAQIGDPAGLTELLSSAGAAT